MSQRNPGLSNQGCGGGCCNCKCAACLKSKAPCTMIVDLPDLVPMYYSPGAICSGTAGRYVLKPQSDLWIGLSGGCCLAVYEADPVCIWGDVFSLPNGFELLVAAYVGIFQARDVVLSNPDYGPSFSAVGVTACLNDGYANAVYVKVLGYGKTVQPPVGDPFFLPIPVYEYPDCTQFNMTPLIGGFVENPIEDETVRASCSTEQRGPTNCYSPRSSPAYITSGPTS